MFKINSSTPQLRLYSVDAIKGQATNQNPEAFPTPKILRGERHHSTIKFYDKEKYYGFIYDNNSTRDMFLHGSQLKELGLEDIERGTKVSYEICKKGTKLKAINLRLE